MTRTSLLCAAALAAALSACTVNNEAPQANDANAVAEGSMDSGAMPREDTTTPGDVADPAPGNDGDSATPPGNDAEDDSEDSPPTVMIPAQYRGRWGMVPGDCTSTRGDAKGLITIDSQTIKFYESRAVLQEQRPAIATSFSGTYVFTGEGQTWERVVTLTRTGNKLKRAQQGENYTYTRC